MSVIELDSARSARAARTQQSVGSPAERAVAAAAALVDPIGLAELNALAELQTRVDRKYFVPAARVPADDRGAVR